MSGTVAGVGIGAADRRRREPAAGHPRGGRLDAEPWRSGAGLDAVAAGHRRHLGRLDGGRRRRAGTVRPRRRPPAPGGDHGRGGPALLRGLRQRHPVAPVPRRPAGLDLQRSGLGRLPTGQRALRGGGRGGRPAGGPRLDPGLPPPARAPVAAGASSRRGDRVLHAHPVPAGRAVHAVAVADRDRRRPGGV